MTRIEEQTLALAGVFQAAALVDRLSIATEPDDASAFNTSFNSLFAFSADSTAEIFGGSAGLSCGFNAIVNYLGLASHSGKNIAYYVVMLLKVAKTLTDQPEKALALSQQLRDIETTAKDFDIGINGSILKIDRLYQETISTLGPRIMVRGSEQRLNDNQTAAKIRTLLLAGVRAAVLWHQLGGSRWGVFWHRKRYVDASQQFLQQNISDND